MTSELEQRLREALHEDAERARLVNPRGPAALDVRDPLDAPQARWTRRIVAIAAAVALIAAAGIAVIQDGDRSRDVTAGPSTEGDDDQAIADGAVLTPDDMPSGWEPVSQEVAAQWQADEQALD